MPFLGVQPTDTFAAVAKQTITGDGSTTYTLTHSVASANDLSVFVNNVRQEPTTAYSASGTSITFTEAIASTDSCYVVYIARTFQTLSPPDNSVNADQISYPLTNFSSTGIDDNADATAITIDSSENVIVGRTSLSAAGLGVGAGKNITFSEGSSVSYANMYRQNTSGGLMLANGYQYGGGTNGDHSSVGSSFAKTLIGLRNGRIQFYADAAATASIGTQVTPTEIMRVTPDGLTFNGDTAAANALDDYEEGTWTPVMIGDGGTNPTVSYGNQVGYYTKVGNVVTVSWYSGALNISNAGSGFAYISGLPYSASTAAGHYPVCKVTHNSSTNHACDGGYIYASNLRLMQAGLSTSLTTWTSGNPRYLMIGAVYRTA